MYKFFSERMKERGYERTAEQCHLKVKKLRQQYIKVRDAIRKSGASTNAKDTFAFYDEMDTILGTRPTSSPIKVLESSTSSNETASSGTENTSESGENPVITNIEGTEPGKKTPCSRRKRRGKDTGMEMYKRFQENFNQAESRRQEKEDATLERWMLKMQESEERRFRMLMEQQAATNTMFMNVMQTFMQGNNKSQSPHNATSWSPMHPHHQPHSPLPAPSDWAARRSPHPATQAQPTNPFAQAPYTLYQNDSGEPSNENQQFFQL
ncbi:uncharacterized protein LOC114567807 [Perca flavescens]|uniref:uncharacterized protein LOC114567807 n=1 Tax=Perca flavescens TaxID=8167 RepID=UPI00106E25E6|nr:uncharacterized protein LOC114567807 [Perca flavescens]